MSERSKAHDEDVTTSILEALEAGVRPWRRPWRVPGSVSPPLRSNGAPFRGANALQLMSTAAIRDYVSPYWLTFNQAKAAGGRVRRGAKGVGVALFAPVRDALAATTDNEENEDEDESRPIASTTVRFVRRYKVFNADDVDGLPAAYHPAPEDWSAIETPMAITRLEAAFAATEARIRPGGSRAFYNIRGDWIGMPPIGDFRSARSYYATLSHELAHWTGHVSRLGQFGAGGASRRTYAFEELVAEIGACFLGLRIDLEPDYGDTASYLSAWLEELRRDRHAIFVAAGAAQKAADFAAKAMGLDAREAAA